MAHISLSPELPGITAGFAFRPETAAPMRALAHALLFDPGSETSLSSFERELIASYVSSRNRCYFCQASHGAAAASHGGETPELVAAICTDPNAADIPEKLKALLAIAACVQGDAKSVTEAHIAAARAEGASDLDIHDVSRDGHAAGRTWVCAGGFGGAVARLALAGARRDFRRPARRCARAAAGGLPVAWCRVAEWVVGARGWCGKRDRGRDC